LIGRGGTLPVVDFYGELRTETNMHDFNVTVVLDIKIEVVEGLDTNFFVVGEIGKFNKVQRTGTGFKMPLIRVLLNRIAQRYVVNLLIVIAIEDVELSQSQDRAWLPPL
jgi:hypothetical protein